MVTNDWLNIIEIQTFINVHLLSKSIKWKNTIYLIKTGLYTKCDISKAIDTYIAAIRNINTVYWKVVQQDKAKKEMVHPKVSTVAKHACLILNQ